jgi:hypothetical protein
MREMTKERFMQAMNEYTDWLNLKTSDDQRCDRCGCHPSVTIKSDNGTHCKMCWEVLQKP